MHVSARLRPYVLLLLLPVVVGWSIRPIHSAEREKACLSGTEKLTWRGDFAEKIVSAAHRFLDSKLADSIRRRPARWDRDLSSPRAYVESVRSQRQLLAKRIGAVDPRVSPVVINWHTAVTATTSRSAQLKPIGRGANFEAFAIRWPVVGDVWVSGLLLLPDDEPVADVIAIPDCEITPAQLSGLSPGLADACQYSRRLAVAGCRVVVPQLINRQFGQFDWGPRPAPEISNREMLYRSAYQLGRGLIGYEVQSILAVVDWFDAQPKSRPVGVIGYGEGGLLALYGAALDPRINVTLVSGYFGPRQEIWREPIDRNVFGLLRWFGDAEIATLVAPRRLIIEPAQAPETHLSGAGGGAPGEIQTPSTTHVQSEVRRARAATAGLDDWITLVPNKQAAGSVGETFATTEALRAFLRQLVPELDSSRLANSSKCRTQSRSIPDQADWHRQQMQAWDRHSQQLLRRSAKRRERFMSDVDTSSLETFATSIEPYRRKFYEEVIGRYDEPLAKPSARTRRSHQTDRWTAYEVEMDVFRLNSAAESPTDPVNLMAYGLLLIPNDIRDGEKRPVVVCQHGLEGRPQDTVGPQGHDVYARFASALAERGFITFAPQNLYIGGDRFRSLQRKSYPLQKTLFSIIVPQHQQIVSWLQSLDIVDPERIAFYGLSYGGKTAMRVPPLVTDYCAVICSADFNEWVDKNASTTNPRSYVWTGEYEIFEFNLGGTFNYAEMATLIAPRPFMVERGHHDGVADDWTVAWEFAKVRHLYAAQLKLPNDRCQIEWFDGPHKINGLGTYKFLEHHLRAESDNARQ